jgi:hypothetical protein
MDKYEDGHFKVLGMNEIETVQIIVPIYAILDHEGELHFN